MNLSQGPLDNSDTSDIGQCDQEIINHLLADQRAFVIAPSKSWNGNACVLQMRDLSGVKWLFNKTVFMVSYRLLVWYALCRIDWKLAELLKKQK
jgi:hypothetical protein